MRNFAEVSIANPSNSGGEEREGKKKERRM